MSSVVVHVARFFLLVQDDNDDALFRCENETTTYGEQQQKC